MVCCRSVVVCLFVGRSGICRLLLAAGSRDDKRALGLQNDGVNYFFSLAVGVQLAERPRFIITKTKFQRAAAAGHWRSRSLIALPARLLEAALDDGPRA